MDLDKGLIELVNKENILEYNLWEPSKTMVILGRTNNVNLEVNLDNCLKDKIPVIKRPGGGGAVVLSKGMLIISFAKYVTSLVSPSKFFNQVNKAMIVTLEQFGIQNLSSKGYSDICIGNRKIFGSSLFLSKNKLFYQAALLVKNNVNLIVKYLKHPTQEPKYREKREHRDFLTNLFMENYNILIGDLKNNLGEMINVNLR